MGKDFYDAFPRAQDVFHEVDDVLAHLLNQKLTTIIFEGPPETLTRTLYTQAALMTTSMAMLYVMEDVCGKRMHDMASFVAGHSLGEYTALCAAGVLTLRDTARLLYFRGKAMTEAAPKDGGAMAAIMGLETSEVAHLTQEAGAFMANDNGGGQVVISGTKEAVERAMAAALERGAKRALALPVSAPFHCPLMEGAATVMKEKLSEVTFTPPTLPIITNVTAQAITDPEILRTNLVDQICGQVRWRESVEYMAAHGVTHTLEVGAGKVLTNLIKRTSPSISATTLGKVEELEIVQK
jgi:[acyl-carrier-protein] S-malonyltransferase